MLDPVITPSGNTYSSGAINAWIERRPTSPITRKTLKKEMLVKNRAVQGLLEGQKAAAFVAKPEIETSENGSEACERYRQADALLQVTRQDNKTAKTAVVTVLPSNDGNAPRTPTHVALVIDVSGSMGSLNSSSSQGGETSLLSILDIVKHAAKTVIGMLGPRDMVSIVSFSSTASVLLDSFAINAEGRKKVAERIIDSLKPQCSTNLWDGLVKALGVFNREKIEDGGDGVVRMKSIHLLTDGVPNVIPPKGHIPTLKKWLAKNDPRLNFSLNTYGFGYQLNSSLLLELAQAGGGVYGFIPDESFVGTVFVNSIASDFCRAGYSAKLVLSANADNGSIEGVKMLGAGHGSQFKVDCTIGATGVGGREMRQWKVNIGSLHFDQRRVFMFEERNDQASFNFSLEYVDAFGNLRIVKATPATQTAPPLPPESAVAASADDDALEGMRLKVIDDASRAMALYKGGRTEEARELIQGLLGCLERQASCGGEESRTKVAEALIADVKGQISEAFSRDDYFERWGVHYLPAILRAHALQVCTNFKDPGVQFYGGALFKALREDGDDIFMSIPPPKPSGGGVMLSRAQFSSQFYNSSNPCFHGDCTAVTTSGNVVRVKDLKRGDCVLGEGGKAVRVAFVVATLVDGGKCDMVTLDGGLCATPYHPVKVSGKWRFPKDLGETKETACDAVYSFVVEGGASIQINGVPGIALAHGIVGDDVASHPFLGTSKIVERLQEIHGGRAWQAGYVVFKHGCMTREIENDTNTLISGFDERRVAEVAGGEKGE